MQPLRVTSTLDGKTVLPLRIPWVAHPTAAVKEVRFLIDGKVRWIERHSPYTYAEDDGYLVTTWLAPGPHRFTVRATTIAGRTASRTVIARVRVPPAPPRALAGAWSRVVTAADQRRAIG